jgi:hypothetical protein
LKHHRPEAPVAGYEPQVRGVKFGWIECASGLTVNAVSRPRNPAMRRDVNAEKESW